ncbi:hypothetical protein CYY_001335 [Polysphondylium violaceum]|uniref:DNA mismatch repair proteins mutS family domain-containing protein n=1 Tax=Polysphondylium violaceum TaxID=133409 RepID=A0A8J4Q248_9MYCE|nr:hypothetical protein CYY_001335 [Polysphondylium violaceum]
MSLLKTPIRWIDNDLPPADIIERALNSAGNNNNTSNNNNNNNGSKINSNNDAFIQDREEIILSLIYHDLKIGIAYYDRLESNIYLCESWEDENFLCVQLLLHQIKPKIISIPSRMPQSLVNLLQSFSEPQDATTNTIKTTYPSDSINDNSNSYIQVLKGTDYSFESSKNRLLNLNLPNCQDYQSLERLKYLNTFIDFENKEMIRALGGLLVYLSKYLVLDEFDTLENFHINEIISFSFDHFLKLDLNTLYSLQIFNNETHPSYFSTDSSKEGLSLFGIIDKTKTTMGKRLLKSWFIRPPRKLSIIEQRHRLISFFIHPDNISFKSELIEYLSNIKDLKVILNRLKLSNNPSNGFIGIFKSLHYFLKIKSLIIQRTSNGCSGGIELFQNVHQLYPPELQQVYNNLLSTYQLDENGHVEIKDGLDQQLDQLRNIYNSMDTILTEHGEQEQTKFSQFSWINSFRFVYYPQLGCLICIPINVNVNISTQRNIPLHFLFQTNGYLYFQSDKTKELDNYFGDIHSDILDIESRIERDTIDLIISKTQLLVDIVNFSAELDCIFSLSTISKDMNFVKPEITTQHSIIDIINGKHPLQELCLPIFIPNDTYLNNEKSIVIISGPNQSGKSIYIKQIAIIVYLTHLGCFVPAERATVSLFDRIFTRISSRECNFISESSFMIDCKQISQMTRFATSNSLLVIDEYGKGTNPSDGISLLYGLLLYFLSMEKCPKILVSTHFYELIDLLHMHKEILASIHFCFMEFMIKDNSLNFNNLKNNNNQYSQNRNMDFIPLFKLKQGLSNSSFGLACAKNAGVPIDILERAQQIMDHQKRYKKIDCNLLTPIPSNRNRLAFYNNLLSFLDEYDPSKDNIQPLLNIIQGHQHQNHTQTH